MNLVDSTGHYPLRAGYVEGFSLSGAIIVGRIAGEEIVYDYATMTRARFFYDGNIAGLVVAGSTTVYAGGVIGFRYGKPLDTQDKTNLFVDDYQGPFDGAYFGATLRIVEGVSAGAGVFHSPDWSIKGAFMYVSGSIGAPIPVEGAIFSTNYRVDSEVEHYADEKGKVDRARLISDILRGDNSPIPFGAFPNIVFPGPGSLRNGQISSVLLAASLFESYHHAYDQYDMCLIPSRPSGSPNPLPNPFENPVHIP